MLYFIILKRLREFIYINYWLVFFFGILWMDNIWMRIFLSIGLVGNFNIIWGESVKIFKSFSND